MPSASLSSFTARFAALNFCTPTTEKSPVRSPSQPILIGPSSCARAYLVSICDARASAPAVSAEPRTRRRRETFRSATAARLSVLTMVQTSILSSDRDVAAAPRDGAPPPLRAKPRVLTALPADLRPDATPRRKRRDCFALTKAQHW